MLALASLLQQEGLLTSRPYKGYSVNQVSLKDIAAASLPGWQHRRPAGLPAGLDETAQTPLEGHCFLIP